jgi:nucleotide-binding universal stress UspA family protein
MTTATTPYRVVVGIDFTDTSVPAVVQGLRLVQARPGAELHLVHVLHSSPPSPDGVAYDDVRLDDAYLHLRSFVTDHASGAPGRFEQHVSYHVRFGDPAEGVHQVAIDVDAEVIVVGTADRRGMARLLLGSVAGKILRIAHAPVLVARRKTYEGLEKTPLPEPARPGEHHKQADMLRSTELVAFESDLGGTHISGML